MVLRAASSDQAWTLTDQELEYEQNRARICHGMHIPPSEWDELTPAQQGVWIEEHNKSVRS